MKESVAKDRAAAANGFLGFRRLADSGLVHIALHKYKGGAYTPLDNAMNSFWFNCAELLPLWIAPNMVTLIGLMFNVLAYTLVVYHQDGSLRGELPPWVNVACAVCLFLYQTLDAMDGKHARRTGNSSPLGQLFDHGCDAISAPLMVLTLISSLQLGSTYQSVTCILAGQIPFFLAQWGESITGTMQHSMGGVFGVTEAQLVVCAIHLLAAYVPASFWTQDVETFVPIGLPVMRMNTAVMCLCFVPGAFMMVFWQLWETFGKASLRAYSIMFGSLLPVLFACSLTATDPGTSETVAKYPQSFFLATAFCMAYLCTQVIVCNMACQNMSPLQPTSLSVLVMALVPSVMIQDVIGISVEQVSIVLTPYNICIWICVSYSLWVFSAINEICAVLDINCLTVNKVKDSKKGN